ncbi:MAG: polymerase sigma factor, sigma-70 family [Gemmatimonadetes bacterium]|nr:polymerase sigma factor, sigma-70 family [Gemmatimonadota bacterium]
MGVNIEPARPASGHDDLPPLLKHACAGDEVAVERLLVRFRDRIHQWAARYTHDADEADDVAQEVMVGLPDRVKRFDQRRPFAAWLYVLTRRVARSTQRTASRRRDLLASFVPDVDEATDSHGSTENAETLSALVLGYFDALPPRQRQVFEMVELRGTPHAVVARELGMQESTVRAHLFKARASIRTKLLEHHEALVREYLS